MNQRFITDTEIASRIYTVQGLKVMFDGNLAEPGP